MPDRHESFARALLDPSAGVPAGLLRPDGAPAARRFDIYRNNVVASLVDALADSGVTDISMPMTPAKVWAALNPQAAARR